MNTRERISEAARRAGFVNKAAVNEQVYWGVDQWYLGTRRYIRITYDNMGRVRSAGWTSGTKSRFFGGYKQAEQILNKIKEWAETGKTPETSKHDYEPDTSDDRYRGDPNCRVCGQGKHISEHYGEETRA